MKWSNYNLMWGRPLRSVLSIFDGKKLSFKFDHLETTDTVIVEKDLEIRSKRVKNFNEYNEFLKNYKIFLDQKEREKIILKK